MPTRNVDLTEHFDQFIDAGISSGRFSDASEIVREALRILEQRQEEDRAKLEWLRAAAKEGTDALDRGEYTSFSSMDDLAAFIETIHDEVTAELASERESARATNQTPLVDKPNQKTHCDKNEVLGAPSDCEGCDHTGTA
ncbi:MAG TPA: type II toxin-antitoxin system ParD family antitoxin [Acidisarcina sp.]